MPELPEVQSIRQNLLRWAKGRRVVDARLYRRDVLIAPGDPVGGFARQRQAPKRRPRRLQPGDLLEGSMILDVLRLGKQLAIIARAPDGHEHALGVQLGMSGEIARQTPSQEPQPRAKRPPHAHATWTLDDGVRMLFIDPRRFGGIRVFRSRTDLDEHWRSLGPDALTIADDDLSRACADARRPIKALLMDQSAIAGVGNIYADEALFLAHIAPDRLAATLRRPQITQLASAIRAVLARAVAAGGSTVGTYRDPAGEPGAFQTQHAVYGRKDGACITCGTPLKSARIAQRQTVWCPLCQS